jgi:predicted dehydrogenase
MLRLALGYKSSEQPTVSVIGCGQAAFSTLCYYIYRRHGGVFLQCYDPDAKQATTLAEFYRFRAVSKSPKELIENPELKTLIIASNHASHTQYAIAGLARGLDVFVEKPLCTSHDDFRALRKAVTNTKGALFAGYNRPFAPAVLKIAEIIKGTKGPLTMHAVVHGHLLEANHWYRDENEGTRVSGNMGHWIDLAVHLMYSRGQVPNQFQLSLHGSGPEIPKDDNVVLVISSEIGDLISVSLNARHEPFEGIREVIELQCGDFTAQIDDFRKLRWWQREKRGTVNYRPKDVGHRQTTLQPFNKGTPQRSWKELELSTALMLEAADLARKGGGTAQFNRATLDLDI